MSSKTTLAALLAATALLAACSGETTEPMTNEEAVPVILSQTVGKTPSELMQRVAGNFYESFSIARGLGGEAGESWDEERFTAELASAFGVVSDQIDTAFAARFVQDMEEGEGQALVDLLAEGKNAEYADCVFNSEDEQSGNRLTACAETVGMEASQELQDALGNTARRIADAMQKDETVALATSYATCSVLAKFGKEVSRENFELSLATTSLGFDGDQRECSAYDALAAEKLSGDLPANFPDEAEEAATAEADSEEAAAAE